jgi:hypothetical protein
MATWQEDLKKVLSYEIGKMRGKSWKSVGQWMRDGLPVEMICKYTALSKETIERLLAKL